MQLYAIHVCNNASNSSIVTTAYRMTLQVEFRVGIAGRDMRGGVAGAVVRPGLWGGVAVIVAPRREGEVGASNGVPGHDVVSVVGVVWRRSRAGGFRVCRVRRLISDMASPAAPK